MGDDEVVAPITPGEAVDLLDFFVSKATKWSVGADELAREERIYEALDVLREAVK